MCTTNLYFLVLTALRGRGKLAALCDELRTSPSTRAPKTLITKDKVRDNEIRIGIS
jgi:tRNA(Met) C34 N-acetyltransferase TmcA